MAKRENLHWQGRPIVHPDDVHGLETNAAIYEFHSKLPRHEAEQRAHDDYIRDKRYEAAAHHLAGMKAAQGAGYMDEARKHSMLYELHLKALGHEPVGPVPPEVEAKLESTDREQLYRFKAHRGDLFALQKEPDQEAAPDQEKKLDKAAKRCSWRLGERRCGNFATRQVNGKWYCHHERHGGPSEERKVELEPDEGLPIDGALAKAEPLAKMASKNVRANTRNLPPGKARERILNLIRRKGFRARESTQDRFGVGRDQRELTYTMNAGSPEHELAHALQTPEGQTLREYQRDMGQVAGGTRTMDKEQARHEEMAAFGATPHLLRQAGVSPGEVGPFEFHARKGNEATRQKYVQGRGRGKAAVEAHDEGRLTIDKTGRVVPGTSVHAKINQRAHDQKLGKNEERLHNLYKAAKALLKMHGKDED